MIAGIDSLCWWPRTDLIRTGGSVWVVMGSWGRGRIALVFSSSVVADTAFIPSRVSSLPCKCVEVTIVSSTVYDSQC